MNQPERKMIGVLALILTVILLIVPAMAAEDGTTELHIVKYASDEETILNEKTVDYHWLEENLPVQGDGVTRHYHQGPVFEGVWEDLFPDEEYDGWNPREDINISILYKGDFGAVMGTDIRDICEDIGGAEDGDQINVHSRDGYTRTFPYSVIYEPDPRQGPAVLCWYSGAKEGPDMQDGKEQGQGYPDTGYIAGMRLIFFADDSTNPWGWHVFGNNDMKECWDKDDWNYGGQYPSAAGTSPMWISEVRIYSQIDPPAPVVNFTADVVSGTAPLTVEFTDSSTENPTEWFWEFGDDSTSDEQNPVHIYTDAGTYAVTLTATNDADSTSATEDDYITVLADSTSHRGSDHGSHDDRDPADAENTTSDQLNATPDAENTTAGLDNMTYESGQMAFTTRTYSFEGGAIDEIAISGDNFSESQNLSCETTLLPGNIPEVPGRAYSYYNITPDDTNLTISKAVIRFSLPSAWITENRIGVGGLSMYHYNGNWISLPTTQICTINGSCMYEATTPGFSLFAISGSEAVLTDATTPAKMETNLTVTQAAGNESTEGVSVLLIMGILILVSVIGVLLWHYGLHNNKSIKKGGEK